MKAIAVFIAILGFTAAEVIYGDGGSYSYRLSGDAALAPIPELKPEPEPAPTPAPTPAPVEIPSGYYYRLNPAAERPAYEYVMPMAEPIALKTNTPSGYSYRLISESMPEQKLAQIPLEPASAPAYSYRLINGDEAEKPASGFPNVLPNALYNWWSGVKPSLSQYLPQLAQYRPDFAYRMASAPIVVPEATEVKVEEKEMPTQYSYRMI